MPKLSALFLAAAVMFAPPAVAQVSNIDKNESFAAIMAAGSTAAKIRAVRDVPSVGVIRLYYRVPYRSHEFRLSADRNANGIKKLRQALRANPVTRAALAEHGVAVSDVVGARVGSNGALRVFVLP